MVRNEKKWRSRATTWSDSHMSPNCIRMDQPTPMRRIPIAPIWTMIVPSNEAISNEMTACNDVIAIIHGCKTTCLLAFSTLIRTECSTPWLWSTSWTVTRRVLALAFLYLYCWRVFWFRFFLASEFGWLGGGVGGEGFGCCSEPKYLSNNRSIAIWNAVMIPLTCSTEKPGIDRIWRPVMATFGRVSPLGFLKLHGLLDWL